MCMIGGTAAGRLPEPAPAAARLRDTRLPLLRVLVAGLIRMGDG